MSGSEDIQILPTPRRGCLKVHACAHVWLKCCIVAIVMADEKSNDRRIDELITHICQNTVKTATLVDIRPGYLILQPFLAEDQKNKFVCDRVRQVSSENFPRRTP